MMSIEKMLLLYRQRLRIILDQHHIASNPGVTDEWILDELEKLVYELGKKGILLVQRRLTDEEIKNIEDELNKELPDSILKDDDAD